MINRDAINVDQTDEMYSVVKEHVRVNTYTYAALIIYIIWR